MLLNSSLCLLLLLTNIKLLVIGEMTIERKGTILSMHYVPETLKMLSINIIYNLLIISQSQRLLHMGQVSKTQLFCSSLSSVFGQLIIKVFTSSLFNSYTLWIPKQKMKVNNWKASRFGILVIQGLFASFEKQKSCGEKEVWLYRGLEPGHLCNDTAVERLHS